MISSLPVKIFTFFNFVFTDNPYSTEVSLIACFEFLFFIYSQN
jgi:hypothetical protein